MSNIFYIGDNTKTIKIAYGSKSWNVGSNPTSSISLITTSQIAEVFGVSSFDKNRFTCVVTNGDYSARQFYVTGTYVDLTSDILQVVINTTVTYGIRLNYIFFYVV